MDFLAKKVPIIMSSVVVNKAFVTSREHRFCRRLVSMWCWFPTTIRGFFVEFFRLAFRSRVGFFSKESTTYILMSSVVVNKGGPFVCVF